MAEPNRERREVVARIVYWGIEGSGKSANLRKIHDKLRPDHRGSLRSVPTPLDPTVTYEVLPIELGDISGLRTRIQTIAVPGSPEHVPTRKQLLDQVDGIVFVIDARRECIDANIAAFEELRQALAAYGRSLEEIPLLLQYNKRDLSDPYALEELHRKLHVQGSAAFEAVASEGTGVIQTLTTISKRVIRSLRESGAVPVSQPASPSQAVEPAAEPPLETEEWEAADPAQGAPAAVDLEAAALVAGEDAQEDAERVASQARDVLDASWSEVTDELPSPHPEPVAAPSRIVRVGRVQVSDGRSVELPVVLDAGGGRELRFRVTLALEEPSEESDS